MKRIKTSNVSISNSGTDEFWWQIYCKNWSSDRAFYVITIADADIWSLKSLHTLFDKYVCGPHAGEMWTKLYGPNHTKFCAFLTKKKKWLTIFDKVLTPFWKTFLLLKQLFDVKILIQRVSSFRVPKKLALRHVIQVKSCTKHGRPDQSQRKLTVALRFDRHTIWVLEAKTQIGRKWYVYKCVSRRAGYLEFASKQRLCTSLISSNSKRICSVKLFTVHGSFVLVCTFLFFVCAPSPFADFAPPACSNY